MRTRTPWTCAAIALLISSSSFAGTVTLTERLVKELQMDSADSLWIDNPVGNIDIVGSESGGLVATVIKTTTGVDQAALKEGSEQTVVSFEGDRKVRLIRTIFPRIRSDKWTSNVSYTIRVPRTIQVKIASRLAGHIRVVNILGSVTVTTFTAAVVLDGVSGSSLVETTNGTVVYIYHDKQPTSPAQVQAVNADIDVIVPPASTFTWIADTLKGDILSNIPARTTFLGNAFRAVVNGSGGPTISLQTLIGNIRVLGTGMDTHAVQSLRNAPSRQDPNGPTLLMRPSQRVQLPISGGPFDFSGSIADVEVGEIRGWARVQTAGGEVKLGMVYGDCFVDTKGGPIDLGEITGSLTASTEAGDVLVRTAREGGKVSTAGGIIRLFYTGGPTTLQSGGGDISVQQAAGSVSAETRSGDISITADSQQKTQKLQAHTQQGSISINLPPRFAADIDATVLTSRPNANAIQSDFAGLTIKKEQVGDRTRIHATGKLNGGGERVELFAEEGDIHISNAAASATTMGPP